MRRLVILALVLVVAVGALGYWRGWFNVTDVGKVEVKVDSVKLKQDKKPSARRSARKPRRRKSRSPSSGKRPKGLMGPTKPIWKKSLRNWKRSTHESRNNSGNSEKPAGQVRGH